MNPGVQYVILSLMLRSHFMAFEISPLSSALEAILLVAAPLIRGPLVPSRPPRT